MFCTRCGLKVEEGMRFCANCGQETGVVAPAAVSSTTNAQVAPFGQATLFAPLPYAGFWVRFAAYVLDGLILGVPMTVAIVALVFMSGGLGMIMRANVDPNLAFQRFVPMIPLIVLAWFLFLVVTWLYFAGMESSGRQATFGKAAMSLNVTNAEGKRLSFGHATGRFFAKMISGMIPLGIGYIMAGFTGRKQALHDMIAGTLVLRK